MSRRFIVTVCCLAALSIATMLPAMSDWSGTIKARQCRVSESAMAEVQKKYPNPFEAPANAFITGAAALGEPVEFDSITIYVNSAGDMASVSIGPDGKVKFVYKNATETIHVIQYNEKRVMFAEKKDVQETTKQAADVMSDMNKRMAEAMKGANLTKEQEEAARRYLPGFGKSEEDDATVEATSKTRSHLDRTMKLFVVRKGPKTKAIWAASDDKDLEHTFRTMSKRMRDMVSMGKQEKDEAELLPAGYYPLESVEIESGSFGGREIDVRETLSIQRGNPGKEPFYVPGKADGFTVSSFKEAMSGMQPPGGGMKMKRR